MYRKRRLVAPYYRVPAPYEPVEAEHASLRGDKPLCRFVLEEALTSSDATAKATIAHQWGQGSPHPRQNDIVVINPETDQDDVYMWEAEEDDAGLAYWDTSRAWVILMMLDTTWKYGCDFEADTSFDENDEWVLGTVTDQYGPGTEHTVTSGIFHNLRRHDDDYEFEGDEGDRGRAIFDKYEVDEEGDYGTADALVAHWIIYQFECP